MEKSVHNLVKCTVSIRGSLKWDGFQGGFVEIWNLKFGLYVLNIGWSVGWSILVVKCKLIWSNIRIKREPNKVIKIRFYF